MLEAIAIAKVDTCAKVSEIGVHLRVDGVVLADFDIVDEHIGREGGRVHIVRRVGKVHPRLHVRQLG